MASNLTKYSTANDVLDALRDNASFVENNSVVEARAFVTAYHHWLTWTAKMARTGGQSGESFEMQAEQWAAVYETAKRYVAVGNTPANGGSGIVDVNFGNFRD